MLNIINTEKDFNTFTGLLKQWKITKKTIKSQIENNDFTEDK